MIPAFFSLCLSLNNNFKFKLLHFFSHCHLNLNDLVCIWQLKLIPTEPRMSALVSDVWSGKYWQDSFIHGLNAPAGACFEYFTCFLKIWICHLLFFRRHAKLSYKSENRPDCGIYHSTVYVRKQLDLLQTESRHLIALWIKILLLLQSFWRKSHV